MKKFILLVACVLSFEYASSCSDYDPEYEYYNLFMQELISDAQYYPFLLTYESGYYTANDSTYVKNENIEEWQNYLAITYDQAFYLVYIATRNNLQSLIQGKKATDPKLDFANGSFVAKHMQALRYLSYAKYLEPYMTIHSEDTDSWSYRPDITVANLNYRKVMTTLEKSWATESDKELKLRYGYQMVRFAHYNREFKSAVNYFYKYVEALKFKPAIYYYALDQKAGAEAGLKQYSVANYDFFLVFSHSKNLKESAFQSIRFSKNTDYTNLLNKAKTATEKNDVYLMLGYLDFNNPLSSLTKIVKTTPDAIQAKVLMARAINSLERSYIPTNNYGFCDTCYLKVTDKRFPIAEGVETEKFFNQLLTTSKGLANNANVKEKNFWNLTSAYLLFLKKDFSTAKQYLAKVETKNKLYATQKTSLAMYIDICEQPLITADVEKMLSTKYKSTFLQSKRNEYTWRTDNFLEDVLANRYYIQKDYAKSFLMSNNITSLENNPDMTLLDALEAFYNKANKNDFEKYIAKNMYPSQSDSKINEANFDMPSYFSNMRGTVYLANGDIEKALASFKKVNPRFSQYRLNWSSDGKNEYTTFKGQYNGFSGISNSIFGYNKIECFDCGEDTVMQTDYLKEFPFIKPSMNKLELTEALLELRKTASLGNEQAAKANYLLGNFFYNTTSTGYFRHILRFDQDNAYCEKYRSTTPINIYSNIYFKNYGYSSFFVNKISVSQQYLEKAYQLSQTPELKARIAFALSKCEQETYYEKKYGNSYYWVESDDILIKNRKYFAELNKYKNTSFYNDIKTSCLYFNYYVNHY